MVVTPLSIRVFPHDRRFFKRVSYQMNVVTGAASIRENDRGSHDKIGFERLPSLILIILRGGSNELAVNDSPSIGSALS